MIKKRIGCLLTWIFIEKHKGTADQELLNEAGGLISSIYSKGSKGKKSIPLSEAQKLVVDTFRLVSLLLQVTDLTPIDSLA